MSASTSMSPKLKSIVPLQSRFGEIKTKDNTGKKLSRRYEVFLSFRGEDTRASFTSHLYDSLQQKGITVFKDDDSLQRGDQISTSLLQAIEESQIAVIVFSKNYADSRWCLQELSKIMECRRTMGQIVLPVFYDVDPSEIRHQTGEFGKAFQSLLSKTGFGKPFQSLLSNISKEEEDRLLDQSLSSNNSKRLLDQSNISKEDGLLDFASWREALIEAAGLAGFVVLNSRNESKDIKDVTEKIIRLLDKKDLFVVDKPVGVDSRMDDVIQLLDIQQSNDVLLIGMWGMGGIGKTTIAKAIYNEIGRSFEGRSFLANVREVWQQPTGQVDLQEQLLYDTFKRTTSKIRSIDSGKIILRDMLCHSRVLIVLDDVDDLVQLDALCGSRNWFGSGSRIIITTRDKSILKGYRVDKVYSNKKMNESESTELFAWHAFKQASPNQEFDEISKKVVKYSGGLPLALEVLGRYLFEREVKEWMWALEKLKKIPNDKVQKKLKISYDGLDDDYQKEIFLDIACFFIGMDQNDVTHILDGCGFCANIGITVLVERSLVTIDDENKLRMHDLLRDMGREIVCNESRKKPEMRTRLWFNEDVDGVLAENIGTESVEGLALKFPRDNAKPYRTEAFVKMKKLRLLQLAGVQLDGDFAYLPRNLSWLSWNGFPLSCIPKYFYQGNLVSIELENSNVKVVWKDSQMMEKLKILNLSHSHYLTQTPDFSYLPNLEKLVLKDCPMLSEVSPSIGDLREILLIDLEDCISLRSLPSSIYKLKSLKTLLLSGCLYGTVWKEVESTSTKNPQASNMKTYTLIIQMGMNCKVTNNLKEMFLQNTDVNGTGGCFLLGDSYPDRFTFHSEGSSITFEVPQVEECNLKSVMMCIVYSSSPDNIMSDGLPNVLVINHTKNISQVCMGPFVPVEDEEGLIFVSSMEPGNKVEFKFEFNNGSIVKNTIVYLIYDELIGEKLGELYHVPDLNAVASSSDNEHESAAKRVSPQEEPTDDFNENRKKKNRVERKMVKQWFGKKKFLWCL